MARLSARLNEIKESGQKALVAYLVAGDPNPKITVPLMHQMVDAGVDVIELGMPFSDPEAEGPIIQLAHERALIHKISLTRCLDMVREFREDNSITPVVLMGYLNPIESMGYDEFAQAACYGKINSDIMAATKGIPIAAFPGQNHDAHKFISEAYDLGAVCVVSEKKIDNKKYESWN